MFKVKFRKLLWRDDEKLRRIKMLEKKGKQIGELDKEEKKSKVGGKRGN